MLRLCQAQVQLKLSLVKILKLRQSLICQNKLSQVVRGWGGWFEQGGIFSWIPVNRGLDVNISCEVLRINGLFYP